MFPFYFRVTVFRMFCFRVDVSCHNNLLDSYIINESAHVERVFITYEPRHEKTCFSHMRTTKVQISQRIRAV